MLRVCGSSSKPPCSLITLVNSSQTPPVLYRSGWKGRKVRCVCVCVCVCMCKRVLWWEEKFGWGRKPLRAFQEEAKKERKENGIWDFFDENTHVTFKSIIGRKGKGEHWDESVRVILCFMKTNQRQVFHFYFLNYICNFLFFTSGVFAFFLLFCLWFLCVCMCGWVFVCVCGWVFVCVCVCVCMCVCVLRIGILFIVLDFFFHLHLSSSLSSSFPPPPPPPPPSWD